VLCITTLHLLSPEGSFDDQIGTIAKGANYDTYIFFALGNKISISGNAINNVSFLP
jgi:hypothetical protein